MLDGRVFSLGLRLLSTYDSRIVHQDFRAVCTFCNAFDLFYTRYVLVGSKRITSCVLSITYYKHGSTFPWNSEAKDSLVLLALQFMIHRIRPGTRHV